MSRKLSIDLSGANALVTGASRGIGRAIAEGLAASGARVVVNYRQNVAAATEVVDTIKAAGGEAWAVQADVGTKRDVETLFRAVREHCEERLDILVNNAGGPGDRHLVGTMPEEVWDRCIDVNLKSVFLCTQAAWDLLPDNSGRVINITSISARSGGPPGGSHYSAAKAGLSNFTRACAKELAPRGITVNAIAPGVIYTDIHKLGTSPEQLAELKERTPLGMVGEATDLVGTTLLLCSADSGFMTGEIIEINGGMLMN